MISQMMPGRASDDKKAYGVITGIVKDNFDKKHPGMVKVEYSMGEKGKNMSGWMPVVMPYVGDKYGMCFLPEIGTEVVVAFYMGSWNRPMVIGSLWNKNTRLPDEIPKDNKNAVKLIKTKNGHKIILSDVKDKQSVRIETEKGISLKLEDSKEKTVLSSKKGKSKITIDHKGGGITIDAEKKIKLKIGGKTLLTLESGKAKIKADAISIKAGQGMKVEGQSTSVKGATMSLKASSSLKVDSGGIAKIKGQMLKLN